MTQCRTPFAVNTRLIGVYLVIAGMNLSLLRKKGYRVLLGFTIVQLVVTTLYIGLSLYAAPAQSLAIFQIVGGYGPNALSPWPSVIVDCAFVLNTWTSDAFLVRFLQPSLVTRRPESNVALSMLCHLQGKQVRVWPCLGALPCHRRLFTRLALL